MTNQTGVNLGGKLHGICLSVYCTLMLTSLAVGHSHMRLAQMGGGLSDRVQSGALQALSGAAREGFAGTDGAAMPASVATPQPVSLKTGHISLPDLENMVRSKGVEEPLSAGGSALAGLPEGSHPCKQIGIVVSQEKHGVDLCTANGNDYMVFTRQSGTDLWLFTLETSGQLHKAVHGQKGSGFQEMPSAEGAPLAEAEKGFWLQWAADGGKVASNGPSAS